MCFFLDFNTTCTLLSSVPVGQGGSKQTRERHQCTGKNRINVQYSCWWRLGLILFTHLQEFISICYRDDFWKFLIWSCYCKPWWQRFFKAVQETCCDWKLDVCLCFSFSPDRNRVIFEDPAEVHWPNPAHARPGGHLPLRSQPLDPVQTGECD